MQPFELDPMAMMQAQADRITALTNENVQLAAAVAMLQKQIETIHQKQHELEMARQGVDLNGEISVSDDPTASITDITDQVVGAEMDPKVGPFVGEPDQREHKAEITS
jgi:hypothetical protein